MTASLLLDNSAWVRLGHPALEPGRSAEIADLIETGRVHASPPTLLEAGYSARSRAEHSDITAALRFLPRARLESAAQDRAIDAQAQLAASGQHRIPIVDLLVAAAAEANGIGVLHYDSDYDLLSETTDLDFESVWLAPRGSL